MTTLPDRAGPGEFATRASVLPHKQHGFRPATARRVAIKMGRRPSRACGIDHVSIQICSAPRVRPRPDRRPILIVRKARLLMGQDTEVPLARCAGFSF